MDGNEFFTPLPLPSPDYEPQLHSNKKRAIRKPKATVCPVSDLEDVLNVSQATSTRFFSQMFEEIIDDSHSHTPKKSLSFEQHKSDLKKNSDAPKDRECLVRDRQFSSEISTALQTKNRRAAADEGHNPGSVPISCANPASVEHNACKKRKLQGSSLSSSEAAHNPVACSPSTECSAAGQQKDQDSRLE